MFQKLSLSENPCLQISYAVVRATSIQIKSEIVEGNASGFSSKTETEVACWVVGIAWKKKGALEGYRIMKQNELGYTLVWLCWVCGL